MCGTLDGIGFDFGDLEGTQQSRADQRGVFHLLHPRRKTVPLGVPEVIVHGSRGEQQIVERDLRAAGQNGAALEIDSGHFREHDQGIGLPAQDHPDRLRDVGGGQGGGGDLVQQWLEQVVIVAIDYSELDGHRPQCPGREQSAKTATDNNHAGFLRHLHLRSASVNQTCELCPRARGDAGRQHGWAAWFGARNQTPAADHRLQRASHHGHLTDPD